MISSEMNVLDVGGWHSPLNRANYVIDIMPFDTRNKAGAILTELYPEEHFSRDTYIQTDICGPDPWPFADKQFDFAICSHTLEDIRDPVFVCRELNRVAKAGYIEVPSRLTESTRGVERPYFCGYYHHRWLCEVVGTSITFLFKPAMLHAYRQFHFRKPWYKKMNPELEAVSFFWKNSFTYREKIIIDRDEVQADLRAFKTQFADNKTLFVNKWEKRVYQLQEKCS
jgi:SAM-dependent methyltransferase